MVNGPDFQHSSALSPDGSYAFECTSCGECCRGDIEIRLNLWDLQRMAIYLKMPHTGALFDGGWVKLVTGEAGGYRPVIQFKQGFIRFCPFLENHLSDTGILRGYCRLHPDLKPLVCKLAPLGRQLDRDGSEQWYFTEPIQGCPGCQSSTQCSVSDERQRVSQELHLESLFFRVLQRWVDSDAPLETYEKFYRELLTNEPVENYLARFAS